MATEPGEPAHDLVLICARGDRAYVRDVFAELKARGIRAFYPAHEDFEVDLWGVPLPEYLDRSIRRRTRFAVVFFSSHLLAESDATYQGRLALARTIETDGVFVLPVRMDDSELPGLPATAVGVVDGRLKTAQQLAGMLEQKLRGPEVADRDRRLRVELQVDREPGRPPRSVVIRNLGRARIAGCVFVTRLADPLGLRAWYMTRPTDLAAGVEVEEPVLVPQGVEQATGLCRHSAGPGLRGQQQVLIVTLRAFDGRAEGSWERRGTPARLGRRFPPAGLFAANGRSSDRDDVEAVVFATGDGCVHRLLPHLSPAIHTLDPVGTMPRWAAWYERTARSGPPPPPEVTGPGLPPLGKVPSNRL